MSRLALVLVLALSGCGHKQGDLAPDQSRALIAMDKEFRK